MTIQPIQFRHSCFTWILLTQVRIYLFILTLLVEALLRGLGIYDTMQFISSDVATLCTGMAASMAAVLLVAGKEGKRSALKHSRVMIHQPLGGVQGQASDIEIEAREIQKFKKELYNIISEHSHQPFDKVWNDSDRNYWMTSEEAKEYGMIDEVLMRKPVSNASEEVK